MLNPKPPAPTTVIYFQIYETPFFVCVDREQQTIVIAVRGTLSLKVSFCLEVFIIGSTALVD